MTSNQFPLTSCVVTSCAAPSIVACMETGGVETANCASGTADANRRYVGCENLDALVGFRYTKNNSDGFGTSSGLNIRPSITRKTAAFAPSPTPSDRVAAAVNPFADHRTRRV